MYENRLHTEFMLMLGCSPGSEHGYYCQSARIAALEFPEQIEPLFRSIEGTKFELDFWSVMLAPNHGSKVWTPVYEALLAIDNLYEMHIRIIKTYLGE